MAAFVMYLCKGGKPICSAVGCYNNNGACRWTTDPNYAINGPCDHPEQHPERFEPEQFVVDSKTGKKYTYYWEKEIENGDSEEISEEV